MTFEKIKELAKKAGFYFLQNEGYEVEHTVPCEYSEKCFERFADLILKEPLNDSN